ncbi:MAG: hypothetical protein ACT4O5_16040 [Gammaproteobacteria bacterium]
MAKVAPATGVAVNDHQIKPDNPTSRLHHLDLRSMSVRPREFGIARKQWRIERFGERNVGAVVSGQRFAQLPDARQELSMWVALQDEARKVIQRLLCPSWCDVFELDQPTDEPKRQ